MLTLPVLAATAPDVQRLIKMSCPLVKVSVAVAAAHEVSFAIPSVTARKEAYACRSSCVKSTVGVASGGVAVGATVAVGASVGEGVATLAPIPGSATTPVALSASQ